MSKMIDFFDRLDKYMIYKGLNDNKITVQAGIANGLIGKARKRGALSQENISKLLYTYTDLNANWLFTGEGEMLKNIEPHPMFIGETKSEYLLRTDKREDLQKVPLYNLEAAAGLVQLFQSDQTTPIDYISIPNLPKCDGAIYITGDSMYPLLKSGDIVMYKQINDLENSFFWGEMYLLHIDINGDSYTTVKYVQKSEEGAGFIKLVSQNQHHAPKEIPIQSVKAAAFVKASIRVNSMI